MPAPTTGDEFLELAFKSGLLEPHQLKSYLQRQAEGSELPQAPRALANFVVRDGLLTRYQVEQLLRGKWRNFVLCGKYKVLGPLGAGGMGQVYLCEHQVMRRRVAVKVLPDRYGDPVALERFHREARAVAKLSHPNIVGGHDVDKDGKVHFLVMEYIDGSTFHAIVKQHGPLDPLRAAHYIRQAAVGLQHAHEAGIVHRDIKPSNLLLERSGTVKILDLGLARFFHEDSDDLSRRHADSPLGTMDYMAPEQAVDSHNADIRADIYSLGVTFYYLLAGHSPYRGKTSLQKMICHQFETPTPIREIRPEVPEGLSRVLDRMIVKEPRDRYQTPAELAEALDSWTQTPIPPPPPEEMPGLITPLRSPGDAFAAPVLPASLYGPDARAAAAPRLQKGPLAAGGQNATPTPSQAATAVQPTHLGLAVSGRTPGSAPRASTPPAGSAPGPSTPGPGSVAASLPSAKEAVDSSPFPVAARKTRTQLLLIAAGVALFGVVGIGVTVYQVMGAKGHKAVSEPTNPIAQALAQLPRADGSLRLKLLVPAYIYPGGAGLTQWERIIGSPAAAATVVIVNTSSGPGVAVDHNYTKVLEMARAKGVTVIGYVSTKYSTRPMQEVIDDVDRWLRFYPGIQGIFFDEQASAAGQVHYYAALYQYVRKDRGLSLVVTNPGTECVEEYFARPAADVVCLFEVHRDFSTYHLPEWAERYSPDRFAALLNKMGTLEQMKNGMLQMRAKKIGYTFITDAGEGKDANPWGRLPPYWEDEVEAVQQANSPHDH
jgi:serine/threonine protein kinase